MIGWLFAGTHYDFLVELAAYFNLFSVIVKSYAEMTVYVELCYNTGTFVNKPLWTETQYHAHPYVSFWIPASVPARNTL